MLSSPACSLSATPAHLRAIMSGLELASGIIAVATVATKVGSLCSRYYTGVKNADDDIGRLRSQANALDIPLRDLHALLLSPKGQELSALKELGESVEACMVELQHVVKKLDPGKKHRLIRHLGSQLRWPFNHAEVQKVIENLAAFRETFALALQVDQT